MADVLVTIAVCLALTIIGLVAVQVGKAAGGERSPSEPAPGRELSNAEVTAILKRGK